MFEMNSEDDTVEIKTKVQFEGAAIKKYIEETFDGVLSAYKTMYFMSLIRHHLVVNQKIEIELDREQLARLV